MREGRCGMGEIFIQTYTIALPVVLGYIVWLLKNQKKDRDANSKGTMLLLRVQLFEYHDRYMAKWAIYRLMLYRTLWRCTRLTTSLAETA